MGYQIYLTCKKLFLSKKSYVKLEVNKVFYILEYSITKSVMHYSQMHPLCDIFTLSYISDAIPFYLQYDSLDTLYRIVIIAILAVMLIIECVRLYLGFVGNLTEKVRPGLTTHRQYHYACLYMEK